MNKFLNNLFQFIIFFSVLFGCTINGEKNEEKLPVMGRSEIVERNVNGEIHTDTIPHRIDNFEFYNQDSMVVNNETLKGKIYIADFFFTTCPTICPVMKKQMLRVYHEFNDDDEIMILSHTIDPEHDTVAVLKDFAERLNVSSDKWHFVTGPKEKIYEIGQKSYMVTANEDNQAPGGFIHSGAFILVDKSQRIRGLYDGTVPEQVDQLMFDIRRLKKEYTSNESAS